MIYILQKNPYGKFFRTLRDYVIHDTTTISTNQNSIPDQRTYNKPSSEAVAEIWVDTPQTDTHHGPHILVHGKSNKSHQIKHYYGCYDPLQCPIIFPFGDCGWHPRLEKLSKNIEQLHHRQISNGSNVCQQTEESILMEDHPGNTMTSITILSNISPLIYQSFIIEIM